MKPPQPQSSDLSPGESGTSPAKWPAANGIVNWSRRGSERDPTAAAGRGPPACHERAGEPSAGRGGRRRHGSWIDPTGRVLPCRPGASILCEGERHRTTCFLLAGVVRVFHCLGDGRQYTPRLLRGPDQFGDLELLAGNTVSLHSVEVVQEATLALVDWRGCTRACCLITTCASSGWRPCRRSAWRPSRRTGNACSRTCRDGSPRRFSTTRRYSAAPTRQASRSNTSCRAKSWRGTSARSSGLCCASSGSWPRERSSQLSADAWSFSTWVLSKPALCHERWERCRSGHQFLRLRLSKRSQRARRLRTRGVTQVTGKMYQNPPDARPECFLT